MPRHLVEVPGAPASFTNIAYGTGVLMERTRILALMDSLNCDAFRTKGACFHANCKIRAAVAKEIQETAKENHDEQ